MHDKKRYDEFVSNLNNEPPIECGFKLGDRVTFTNEYGVKFYGLKIIGFSNSTGSYNRFIHLMSDCWWFPKSPESLNLDGSGGSNILFHLLV